MHLTLGIILSGMLFSSARASTHWVVTEEGKLQEKLESPFVINQPHDLMAFMKQESNYEKMQKIKDILIVEKKMIEDNEDKDFYLEEKHYSSDEDCIAAGKPPGEFNLYPSTLLPLDNKEIEAMDYIDLDDAKDGTEEPECEKITDLPYGSISYDNLEGIKNGEYLSAYQAEPVLKSTLKYMANEKQFAHAVNTALKQNASSWIAYNLATSYWRIKGNAVKAMECGRRALHFSPYQYQDVALVNLANVLHRSHYTINASVVLEDALKVSNASVIHFALGCIYAALGDYKLSVQHFEMTLSVQPDFKAAKDRLHAVLCQSKLQLKLEAQHESLQRTLKELEEYQVKHKKYVEYYQAVEKMQLSHKEQIDLHFLLMQHNILEGTFDQKLCKLRSDDNGGPVMFCNLPKSNIDLMEEDNELIPNIISGKHKKTVTNEIISTVNAPSKSIQTNKDEETLSDVPQISAGEWTDPKWPTEEICAKHAAKTLAWDEYPSSYINPEKRGFSVRYLLTTYIGIEDSKRVPQPWDDLNCLYLEPVCTPTIIDKIPGIRDRDAGPIYKADEYMKREMLMHINEGVVWPGEIAHRINRAIKKSLSEKDKDENLWLLYNYAALYFRVIGDNMKAIECIRRSTHRSPTEQMDVAFINAGNILYRLGKINDAMKLFVDALSFNRSEPMTYLAVGNAFNAKGNFSGAVTFYEYGIYLNPQSQESLYALLNIKCSAIRDKKLKEEILGKDYQQRFKLTNASPNSCSKPDNSCNTDANLVDDSKESDADKDKVKEDEVFDTETMHTVTSTEVRVATADCDNASDDNDLVRRLESTKEDADKILHDADAVIKKLSYVAEDGSEELSSSARKIMQQLSQMRDNLGTLMKEASSTLDSAVTMQKSFVIKESFTEAECAHALHNVDLRSFQSFNLDITTRGYNFIEELSSRRFMTQGAEEPYCFPPSSPDQFNLNERDTIIRMESFATYNEEIGLRVLIERLIPTKDFFSAVQWLAEGMKDNPNSWKLAFLSSYYWRFKGRAKEAIDCLRLSLTSAPFDIRDVILLGVANVFAQLNQLTDAVFVTQQALIVNPDYFLHHFTLGNIVSAMGDIKASIPIYKRALELHPNFDMAQKRYEAAVCEVQRGDFH